MSAQPSIGPLLAGLDVDDAATFAKWILAACDDEVPTPKPLNIYGAGALRFGRMLMEWMQDRAILLNWGSTFATDGMRGTSTYMFFGSPPAGEPDSRTWRAMSSVVSVVVVSESPVELLVKPRCQVVYVQ